VRFKNDGYRFFFIAPYSIEVRLSYDEAKKFDISEEVVKFITNQPATARELSFYLKVPVRTMYRKIDELLAANRIVPERIGREVKYRVSN
jgi:hypothetical protein